MHQGWIKLHRRLIEWEWFEDHNTFRLFVYCLLKANHKDKKYKGDIIKRGTFVTSLETLSIDTGISVRSIRTSLKRLESTKEVTSQRTFKGTVIQVVNYDNYQDPTSQTTSERQASDTPTTTTKNVKNEKKCIVSEEDFLNYALSNRPDVDQTAVMLKYKAWVENGWHVERGGKLYEIKNWKNTLLNTLSYLPKSKTNESRDITTRYR